jgi:hypothetical protein
MIIYLAGSDSFQAIRAINQIKEKYLSKNQAFELKDIDASESQPNWADLQAIPLFSSSRLVIIRQVGQLNKADQESLAYFLTGLPATTVAVVWDATKLNATSVLLEILAKADKTISVEPLATTRLKTWLTAELKRRQLELSPADQVLLIERYGNDLWALDSELQQSSSQPIVKLSQDKTFKQPDSPWRDYFRFVSAEAWPKLHDQLRLDYQLGTPIELVIGTLAGAIRTLRATTLRRQLTDLLVDIDFGLKTGLLTEGSAIALLIAHLPTSAADRVQWESVWQTTSSSA